MLALLLDGFNGDTDIVVHDTAELDRDDGLVRLRDGLVEVEGSSLVLLIVGDVRSLDGTLSLSLFGRDLSALDLELVGVQSDFLGLLLDLDVNVDLALVGPATAELEIEQGDGIVGWLDPVKHQC